MKIEQVDVREIADKFGTPVYVYSLETLRKYIDEIRTLAPVVRYAMKACSNVRVLKEMKAKGVHIDAVSVLEVQRARLAGFSPEEICFTSDVFFTPSDAEYCLTENIYTNCGTLGMLEEYGETRRRLGKGSGNVSVRINPGKGRGTTKKSIRADPTASMASGTRTWMRSNASARNTDSRSPVCTFTSVPAATWNI